MVNAPSGQYAFDQRFPDAMLPDDGGPPRDSLGPTTPPGLYLRRYAPGPIFTVIVGTLLVATFAVLLLAQ
jgi:hypothetical protein